MFWILYQGRRPCPPPSDDILLSVDRAPHPVQPFGIANFTKLPCLCCFVLLGMMSEGYPSLGLSNKG